MICCQLARGERHRLLSLCERSELEAASQSGSLIRCLAQTLGHVPAWPRLHSNLSHSRREGTCRAARGYRHPAPGTLSGSAGASPSQQRTTSLRCVLVWHATEMAHLRTGRKMLAPQVFRLEPFAEINYKPFPFAPPWKSFRSLSHGLLRRFNRSHQGVSKCV